MVRLHGRACWPGSILVAKAYIFWFQQNKKVKMYSTFFFQPQLALRALQVAKNQISNVKDTKTASDLYVQVSRSLMLLGRYTEAQSIMDSTGDNKIQGETANVALHLSELYMLTGKVNIESSHFCSKC